MGVMTRRDVHDVLISLTGAVDEGGGALLDDYTAGLTAAWSMDRQLLSSYGGAFSASTGGEVTQIYDQAGAANDFINTGVLKPVATTAGPNSRASALFESNNRIGNSAALDTIIDADAGWIAASVIVRSCNTNHLHGWGNDVVFCDLNEYCMMCLRNGGGSSFTVGCYVGASGGDADTPGVSIALDTPYVFEYRMEGGTLYIRVNASAEQSVASGPVDVLTSNVYLGWQSGNFANINVFEFVSYDAPPSEADRNAIVAGMMEWVGATALDVFAADGSLTGAWSMGRKLLSAYGGAFYTDTAGTIATIRDQLSSGHFDAIPGGDNFPIVTTAGPLSRACARFDGANDSIRVSSKAMDDFITASDGYVVCSGIARAITTDFAVPWYSNDGFWADQLQYVGSPLRNGGGTTYTAHAYSYDGNDDGTAGISIALDTPYVIEWRHEGGQLYARVNGAGEVSVASGSIETGWESSLLNLGLLGAHTQCDVFEIVTFNTVPDVASRNAIVADMMEWVGAESLLLDNYQAGLTGAWSVSRNLLRSFGGSPATTAAGEVTAINDQVASNNFSCPFDDEPDLVSVGPNSRAAAQFDGTNDVLRSSASTGNSINVDEGWVVVSAIVRGIATDFSNAYDNDQLIFDGNNAFGICFKNGGGTTYTAHAWENENTPFHITAGIPIALDTPYVFEWRLESGSLYLRINGGTEVSVAAGDIGAAFLNFWLTNNLGGQYGQSDIFEIVTYDAVPSEADRNAIVASMMTWIGAT